MGAIPLRERVSAEQLDAITLGHTLDVAFEPIEFTAGPRPLPAWVKSARIDWMEGFGNDPALKVRCASDPLEFSKYSLPAWERVGKSGWIAEQDGAAAVHYHGGQLSETEFEEHVRWIDPPSQANGWKGDAETRKYSMLATPREGGYGGRNFDITLKDGRAVRLRGPWHGGAPDGFVEVTYATPEHIARYAGSRRRRRWFATGGYFGLYVREELLLDIFATYVPHVRWARVIKLRHDGESRSLCPLRPETGMPKGWYVRPADCPGHRHVGHFSTGEHPSDRCVFCDERRDPSWLFPNERQKGSTSR